MTNSASSAAAKAEEEGSSPGGFKIFNRIVDWITNDRLQLINVTDRINEIVRKSGIRDGMVHLQSLHTTTALFINEWQDALLHDVRNFLEDLVKRDDYFRHNDPQYSDCERSNADAQRTIRGQFPSRPSPHRARGSQAARRNEVVALSERESAPVCAKVEAPHLAV